MLRVARVCVRARYLFFWKKISQKKFFWRFQRILKGGEKLVFFQVFFFNLFFQFFFNFFKVNSNWFSWRKSGLKQSWKRVFLVFKSNFCMSYLCFFLKWERVYPDPDCVFPDSQFYICFSAARCNVRANPFLLLWVFTTYTNKLSPRVQNCYKKLSKNENYQISIGTLGFDGGELFYERQTITVNHGESRKIIENQWKSM